MHLGIVFSKLNKEINWLKYFNNTNFNLNFKHFIFQLMIMWCFVTINIIIIIKKGVWSRTPRGGQAGWGARTCAGNCARAACSRPSISAGPAILSGGGVGFSRILSAVFFFLDNISELENEDGSYVLAFDIYRISGTLFMSCEAFLSNLLWRGKIW